jgi:hypothetical protein
VTLDPALSAYADRSVRLAAAYNISRPMLGSWHVLAVAFGAAPATAAWLMGVRAEVVTEEALDEMAARFGMQRVHPTGGDE